MSSNQRIEQTNTHQWFTVNQTLNSQKHKGVNCSSLMRSHFSKYAISLLVWILISPLLQAPTPPRQNHPTDPNSGQGTGRKGHRGRTNNLVTGARGNQQQRHRSNSRQSRPERRARDDRSSSPSSRNSIQTRNIRQPIRERRDRTRDQQSQSPSRRNIPSDNFRADEYLSGDQISPQLLAKMTHVIGPEDFISDDQIPISVLLASLLDQSSSSSSRRNRSNRRALYEEQLERALKMSQQTQDPYAQWVDTEVQRLLAGAKIIEEKREDIMAATGTTFRKAQSATLGFSFESSKGRFFTKTNSHWQEDQLISKHLEVISQLQIMIKTAETEEQLIKSSKALQLCLSKLTDQQIRVYNQKLSQQDPKLDVELRRLKKEINTVSQREFLAMKQREMASKYLGAMNSALEDFQTTKNTQSLGTLIHSLSLQERITLEAASGLPFQKMEKKCLADSGLAELIDFQYEEGDRQFLVNMKRLEKIIRHHPDSNIKYAAVKRAFLEFEYASSDRLQLLGTIFEQKDPKEFISLIKSILQNEGANLDDLKFPFSSQKWSELFKYSLHSDQQLKAHAALSTYKQLLDVYLESPNAALSKIRMSQIQNFLNSLSSQMRRSFYRVSLRNPQSLLMRLKGQLTQDQIAADALIKMIFQRERKIQKGLLNPLASSARGSRQPQEVEAINTALNALTQPQKNIVKQIIPSINLDNLQGLIEQIDRRGLEKKNEFIKNKIAAQSKKLSSRMAEIKRELAQKQRKQDQRQPVTAKQELTQLIDHNDLKDEWQGILPSSWYQEKINVRGNKLYIQMVRLIDKHKNNQNKCKLETIRNIKLFLSSLSDAQVNTLDKIHRDKEKKSIRQKLQGIIAVDEKINKPASQSDILSGQTKLIFDGLLRLKTLKELYEMTPVQNQSKIRQIERQLYVLGKDFQGNSEEGYSEDIFKYFKFKMKILVNSLHNKIRKPKIFPFIVDNSDEPKLVFNRILEHHKLNQCLEIIYTIKEFQAAGKDSQVVQFGKHIKEALQKLSAQQYSSMSYALNLNLQDLKQFVNKRLANPSIPLKTIKQKYIKKRLPETRELTEVQKQAKKQELENQARRQEYDFPEPPVPEQVKDKFYYPEQQNYRLAAITQRLPSVYPPPKSFISPILQKSKPINSYLKLVSEIANTDRSVRTAFALGKVEEIAPFQSDYRMSSILERITRITPEILTEDSALQSLEMISRQKIIRCSTIKLVCQYLEQLEAVASTNNQLPNPQADQAAQKLNALLLYLTGDQRAKLEEAGFNWSYIVEMTRKSRITGQQKQIQNLLPDQEHSASIIKAVQNDLLKVMTDFGFNTNLELVSSVWKIKNQIVKTGRKKIQIAKDHSSRQHARQADRRRAEANILTPQQDSDRRINSARLLLKPSTTFYLVPSQLISHIPFQRIHMAQVQYIFRHQLLMAQQSVMATTTSMHALCHLNRFIRLLTQAERTYLATKVNVDLNRILEDTDWARRIVDIEQAEAERQKTQGNAGNQGGATGGATGGTPLQQALRIPLKIPHPMPSSATFPRSVLKQIETKINAILAAQSTQRVSSSADAASNDETEGVSILPPFPTRIQLEVFPRLLSAYLELERRARYPNPYLPEAIIQYRKSQLEVQFDSNKDQMRKWVDDWKKTNGRQDILN